MSTITAAPALDCATCGHTIPKNRGHNVTDDDRVLCNSCTFQPELHPRLWPDCTHGWHDVFDHLRYVAGTRAAVAVTLGIWT